MRFKSIQILKRTRGLKMKKLLMITAGALIGFSANASDSFTYEGMLSDGTSPIVNPVRLKFEVMGDNDCVMWTGQEDVDPGDDGMFSVELSGTSASSGATLAQALENDGAAAVCETGTWSADSGVAVAGAERTLKVTVVRVDSAGDGLANDTDIDIALTPNQTIGAVPYAMSAMHAYSASNVASSAISGTLDYTQVDITGVNDAGKSSSFFSGVDFSGADLTGASGFPATSVTAGSIDTTALGADAVDGTKVADGAIALEHIAADAVDGTKVADGAINSEHIASGAIDAGHLAADVIDGTKIADGGVDSEHIAGDAITDTHIADGAISQAKVSNLTSDLSGKLSSLTGSSTQLTNAPTTTDTDLTVDFTNENLVVAEYDLDGGCAIDISGVASGGAYSLVVDDDEDNSGAAASDLSAAQDCAITATGFTVHTPNGAGSDSTHIEVARSEVVFTFVVVGTNLYVSWVEF
jgi:hypothetical protein